MTDKVRGGFFNLDVDAVRLALLGEPWVSEVTVKRIWPDALRVIVIEQIPVVRWGDSGLLNPAGEYFAPEVQVRFLLSCHCYQAPWTQNIIY